MSVADEITRLTQAKGALKTAINSKIDDDANKIGDETLDEYADFLDYISGGANLLEKYYVTQIIDGDECELLLTTTVIENADKYLVGQYFVNDENNLYLMGE